MDTSSVLSDEDYDVISNPGQRSLESSIADFGHIASAHGVREILPTEAAREALSTVSLSPADIQSWVRAVIDSSAAASGRNGSSYPLDHRTLRVYVDGVFDVLTARCVLESSQPPRTSTHRTMCNPRPRRTDTCSSCAKPSSPSPRYTSWWASSRTSRVGSTTRRSLDSPM